MLRWIGAMTVAGIASGVLAGALIIFGVPQSFAYTAGGYLACSIAHALLREIPFIGKEQTGG